MRKYSDPIKILRGRSGVSVVFVLLIMMFLLSLGASSLAAAGAGVRAGISRREADRLSLYADSIQKTLRGSLENGGVTEEAVFNGGYPSETLGGQIFARVYQKALAEAMPYGFAAVDNLPVGADAAKITVDISNDDIGLLAAGGSGENLIEADGVEASVTIEASATVTFSSSDDGPDGPAEISAMIEEKGGTAAVTVTVKDSGTGKSLATAAVYEFSGGASGTDSGDGDIDPFAETVMGGAENPMTWQIISYDRADIK